MGIVGLDVGSVRIGVAASDELERLATPRATIRRTTTAAALEAIARMVAEVGAGLVVVGLPISFDGRLHEQGRSVLAFGRKLGRRLAAPMVYADETLSSVRAEEALRAAGVRPERLRERLDAAAAAVILQDYLNTRHTIDIDALALPSAGAEKGAPIESRSDPARRARVDEEGTAQ